MNTFNKIAAAPVAAAAAAGAAAHPLFSKAWEKALELIGRTGETAAGLGKELITRSPAIAYGAMLVGGLGAGYGIARLTNPRVVAKNSDKLLESEALATEIAVTEQRLKALEARRRAKKARAADVQRYDRFV